jgi:hypothetical protein
MMGNVLLFFKPPYILEPLIRGLHEAFPDLNIRTTFQLTEDFWKIPKWMAQFGLGYHFYLRQFTIHQEETSLFAEQS